MSYPRFMWTLIVVLLLPGPALRAGTIVAHYDADDPGRANAWADDPTNQGWSKVSVDDDGTGWGDVDAGPVDTDGDYQGTDAPLAWRVDDGSSAAPYYQSAVFTPTQLDAMYDNGWQLEADVRFNTVGFASFGFYIKDATWDIGTTNFYMFYVNSEANTAGTDMMLRIGSSVGFNTGVTFDPDAFYNFVLRSVPGDPGKFTVEIDGTTLEEGGATKQFSPYPYGTVIRDDLVTFGSNSGGGTGQMIDVAMLELTAVPEPSTGLLIVAGLVALVWPLRRRRGGTLG